ncbi:MAG: hypothetical protein GWN00_24360 [Aliifodinibius sp.]|nr:hypothetical protein [candidate division Zixibacteria bacterium]NIT59238.1 hypothetical protein [Fodinibius sp.]NIW40499.1 hypothetical protein [candidate division Zixibacteria bacterium]NIX57822.1 hypothetical protein [candidate division Zixibacteria bacterium]NIY27821.1 hypothetical protein [Fodinibius sp.]
MKFRLSNIRIINIIAALSMISIIISCSGESEIQKDEVMITKLFPDQIGEWKPEGDFETYDREGIFTYINGAGEVYRMYDFSEVWVRHYEKEGASEITVEIFDMGKPQDAYGVFQHASQGGDAGIGQDSEFNGGLLSFWQDRYYVTLMPKQLTDETEQAVRNAAQEISRRIGETGQLPELVSYLPEENRVPNSLKFFHLHTSLNYHYYLASENILNLNENVDAALAIYEPDRAYLALIAYPSPEDAEEARASFISAYIPEAGDDGIYEIQPGKWTAIEEFGRYLIAVFDADSNQRCSDLINAAKENLEL